MSEGQHSNRLIHEKSPYLLQHAHNPVDWFPWGDEAFALAKKSNKPLMVSIGYATCHWCHVMERESFEDGKTAELINRYFIAIKVDREERPDIDSIYMKAVQALGQQGGWPLNVFVTPDGIPFYGGTYFPPVGRHNLPSFSDVLNFLNHTWENEQDKVAKQGKALIEYLKQTTEQDTSSDKGSVETLSFYGENRAAELYEQSYDHLNHGFKFQQQNKFPPSMGLSLLLRHHHRTGNVKLLEMVQKTLCAMKHGGIYDQIGGGLSRYSTDYRWLVPHFEKMLYDNALFVTALTETYQVTRDDQYMDFANDIFKYIDRDMTHPDGGFYSAEDADSEGVEGKFYVWTQEEIESLLSRQVASVAIPFYNVYPTGNWEGNNILHVTRIPEALAQELHLPMETVTTALDEARETLLETRSKRIRPLLDDKILTSWNGLMISAMARAGRVFADEDRIAIAERAMAFITDNLTTRQGRLLRRWREGEGRFSAYLFDYTSLANACCELYEATFNPDYLFKARDLMQIVEEQFASDTGAYFETPADGENLIVRQIAGYDGVEPSGNSNASLVFMKLSAWLLEPEYERKAEKIFLAFYDDVSEYGLNSAFMMQALHLYTSGMKEVAVIGVKGDPLTEEFLKAINQGFFPNTVFAFAYENDARKDEVPLLKDKQAINGKATAYVCHLGACQAPVNSLEEMIQQLNDYRETQGS